MGRTWYQPSRLPAGEAIPGRRIHARLTSSRVTPRWNPKRRIRSITAVATWIESFATRCHQAGPWDDQEASVPTTVSGRIRRAEGW